MAYSESLGGPSIHEDPSGYLENKIAVMDEIMEQFDYMKELGGEIHDLVDDYTKLLRIMEREPGYTQDAVFMELKQNFEQKMTELFKKVADRELKTISEGGDSNELDNLSVALVRLNGLGQEMQFKNVTKELVDNASRINREIRQPLLEAYVKESAAKDISKMERRVFQQPSLIHFENSQGEEKIEELAVPQVYSLKQLIEEVGKLLNSPEYSEKTKENPDLGIKINLYLQELKKGL